MLKVLHGTIKANKEPLFQDWCLNHQYTRKKIKVIFDSYGSVKNL